MLQVGNNNFTSWFVHINYIHHLTLKCDWIISIAISETPQYPSIFWKSWRCQWRLSRARLHEVWSSPRTEQRFSRCLAEGALWRTSQPEEKTSSHKRAGNNGRPRQLHLLWGIAHCRTWPGGRGGNRKRTWEEKKCEARSYQPGQPSPPLQQLEVLLEELPGNVSPGAIFSYAPDQMNRVLAAHARPNAEVQGLWQQRLVRESSEARPVKPK